MSRGTGAHIGPPNASEYSNVDAPSVGTAWYPAKERMPISSPSERAQPGGAQTKAQVAHLAALAWVSMLGTDLLIHAGVLARLYAVPSAFLLDPSEAFALIPIGYLSFLILALFTTHLSVRLGVSDWFTGARFGLTFGGTIWAALVLGLASISTASWSLLLGWFVGQTLELGVAGAVIGAGLNGTRSRKLWILVIGWCIFAFIVTVVLQNVGLAPAAQLR